MQLDTRISMITMDALHATLIQTIHLLKSPFIGQIFVCCLGLSIRQEKNKTSLAVQTISLHFFHFFSKLQGGLLQSDQRTPVDCINELSI